MQFHISGYSTGDPLEQPAAGYGVDRPEELPDTMDVLVVGCGPAGSIAAAQLSQFPNVNTRLIDQRPHRLELANADGVHSRTMETFQAFGFAHEIFAEAHEITDMAFWVPDPQNPENIMREVSTAELGPEYSEWPMMLITQVRIIDHFNRFMRNSPTRMKPDYGWEFVDLEVAPESAKEEYPVTVTLRRNGGTEDGKERQVKAKYVVGADGAKSKVRKSLGYRLRGNQANHAWGVMDVFADTDFPDVRKKCTIKGNSGRSILLIPREGGFLVRYYVDLGEVAEDDNHAVRETPLQTVIDTANEIMHPYSIDVKNVVWNTIYEVGHRVSDHFDDRDSTYTDGDHPRVFIAGDACHTHSAKAGQGMNVSMQDGFNLGWKLGHVVSGNSPDELLRTYAEERKDIAHRLIEFDKEWSTLMATPADQLPDPQTVRRFYNKTAEFNAGYLTEYEPSMLTTNDEHQGLATGYPLGRRFRSEMCGRVCDLVHTHIGHEHTADGRYRIYVFADAEMPGESERLNAWADWAHEHLDSSLFDVQVIFQQHYRAFDMRHVHPAFKPRVGDFQLLNMENAWGTLEDVDIFETRGISRDGAVVVVRPDQYVAGIFPLDQTDELAEFLGRTFNDVKAKASAVKA